MNAEQIRALIASGADDATIEAAIAAVPAPPGDPPPTTKKPAAKPKSPPRKAEPAPKKAAKPRKPAAREPEGRAGMVLWDGEGRPDDPDAAAFDRKHAEPSDRPLPPDRKVAPVEARCSGPCGRTFEVYPSAIEPQAYGPPTFTCNKCQIT